MRSLLFILMACSFPMVSAQSPTVIGPTSPSSGAVADKNLLQQPVFQPGEVFQFQTVDLFKNEVTENFQQTVLSVAGGEATLQYSSDMMKSAKRILNISNLEIRRKGRVGTLENIRFPLSAGDTWKYQYSYPSAQIPDVTITSYITARFVGWEEVTVPAGTYRAARIEHDGYWKLSTGEQGKEGYTLWYAPEVKRFVKEIHFAYDSWGVLLYRYERRLVQYTSGQDMSNPFAVK